MATAIPVAGDPKSKVDKKLEKKILGSSTILPGQYQYNGTETIITSGKGKDLFILQAQENWVTRKSTKEKILNSYVKCVRGAEKYRKNGFDITYSEMSKMDITGKLHKVSAFRNYQIIFGSSPQGAEVSYTPSEDENKSIESPKDYYQKKQSVDNYEYSFYQTDKAKTESGYELRSQFSHNEFTITTRVKFILVP
ncbi:MAG: hypothetical protein HOO06_00340 [Bdellovibrionaceae bacterium]|nr:hypothetical protein [Pseudobdellovibrionaceae bacterium]